jgi:hypothetical protein
MGNWLIERFTLLGVTFQNWVILALAVILVGALIAWWRGQQGRLWKTGSQRRIFGLWKRPPS